MGQKERVLQYMERFGSISTYEAFTDLGVTRLSAVVFNLKADGMEIETKTEYATNRFGEKVHFSRYSLKE